MKAGTQNHVKVKRLMRLAGIPLYRAVGILETIWLLCTDCCDEGNIGKYSDVEIADYLGWDGPNPSELVRHLSDSGWLDPDPVHRLVVHDWLEHAPEYIRERIRKRRMRDGKLSAAMTYAASASDSNGHLRTSSELPPLVPSIPNPTNPNPTQPTSLGCAEVGGQAGGKFRKGWGKVVQRLQELGSTCWGKVVQDAKQCGCTPGLALTLIDYGTSHDFGIGAINCRLSNAGPHLAVDAGWPNTPKPEVLAAAVRQATDSKQAAKQKQENDSLATIVIKQGRREGLPDEEIRKRLDAQNLKWPT